MPASIVNTDISNASFDRPSRFHAVWASRDREQLRESIWQHLTGVHTSSRPGRHRTNKRVPYAFELWIAHLLLLEQALGVAPIPWRELRAEELDGLLLLRAAQERFRREYRPCGQCRAPIKGKICTRCGAVN